MGVTKIPQSLLRICINSLCQTFLDKWKNHYFTNYFGFSEHFINEMNALIPRVLHDLIFEGMVDCHARYIQSTRTSLTSLSISSLVDSILSPSISRLNLHGLRYMGIVYDAEINYFGDMLMCKLPYLHNLVEINLKTSCRDFTLPICTDKILEEIGSTCFQLSNLDVSYNQVTDKGLRSLVPSETQRGCPKLVKVSLFECSVTQSGIVVLLEGLPKLKFLGYRETIQSLRILYNKVLSYPKFQPLQLAHINNMGISSHTCKTLHRLECTSSEVNVIIRLCPKLNGLKVRVKDSSVMVLREITTVTILELVYNLGKPSSPGNNTVQYLQLCGSLFVQLALVCDIFSNQCLKVICEQCNNLKCLHLRSNTFNSDLDITSDKDKCVLKNLEQFKFKTGHDNLSDLCHIPLHIFNYILHKSSVLSELVLIMRNSLLSDIYIKDLFSSIGTSNIKKICIQIPLDTSVIVSPVSLTMMTVKNLIEMCPQLEELGKLMLWDVSSEEIENLRRQLQLTNSALVIV